ncbi:FAD-dependent oxidoreductase [Anaeromyxobacter dehalogenans]|uniref:FAD-binding monooxygenase n=1 Tax=Anaeromyxobacter dehalogenans (strain 2CP-C) TaxID=290397 RepID=Q2IK47_ANADE|nr:NAD(P)/FAD-dependent oxidoreductase [Anaeromyxobacter dehalogenans]ABC82026.1 FAD-binding monooxygenase [Anaeromyxobacter dehalogenans 2CP-C]
MTNAFPIDLRPDYDAIVVGARCAGASTAMLLARAGLRVLAVDREPEGSDALSTHALMRGGALQLARWGLLHRLAAAGTPAIRTATFHYAGEALPLAVKPRDGVDALYAPRRTVLDPLLVEAARAAGAQVVHGVTLLDLVRDATGRVCGAVLAGAGPGAAATVRARLVIGADGLRSRVARLAGAPVARLGAAETGVVYGHWCGLPADGYHWYYAPGVSAGAIPTNAGRTCLFVAVPPRRLLAALPGGLPDLYRAVVAEAAPELAPALPDAHLDARLRAFPGARGVLRRAHGPGWALVGDAGFFRDPLTAHGITDALRDAELLARAVVAGGEAALDGYEAARDGVAHGILEVTDRIASFEWDLDEVRRQHQLLARHMAAEVDLLLGLGAAAAPPPGLARAG